MERTTGAGGKEKATIRGAHDDIANAAAGARVLCRDEVTYTPAQWLRQNVKLEAAYKRLGENECMKRAIARCSECLVSLSHHQRKN